jgi:hypothetical protein
VDLSRCSCDKAGFCPVFRREMDDKNHDWCKNTTQEKRESYYEQNVVNHGPSDLEKISKKFDFPRSYRVPENMDEVEIITFHFNASQSKKLRETYYQFNLFLRNLKDYVSCYEVVFDDRDPEIENSIVIRGSLEKNCMWQKESLMNVAVKKARKKGKKHIIWVDHDLVFSNPNWLVECISRLRDGANFVQPFKKVCYLNKYLNNIMMSSNSRVYVKQTNDNKFSRNSAGAPGACWAANVKDLAKIMPLPNSFVGSGDEFLAEGLFADKPWGNPLKYDKTVQEAVSKHVKKIKAFNFQTEYVDNICYHLWHGDFENRQYTTRYDITKKHNIDVNNDLFVNDDGILEFIESRSKELSPLLLDYFVNRKEDG